MEDELNPEHPVTRAVSEHWHKIAAMVMKQQGLCEVEITEETIRSINGLCIVMDGQDDRLVVRLVAEEMAAVMLEAENSKRDGSGYN